MKLLIGDLTNCKSGAEARALQALSRHVAHADKAQSILVARQDQLATIPSQWPTQSIVQVPSAPGLATPADQVMSAIEPAIKGVQPQEIEIISFSPHAKEQFSLLCEQLSLRGHYVSWAFLMAGGRATADYGDEKVLQTLAMPLEEVLAVLKKTLAPHTAGISITTVRPRIQDQRFSKEANPATNYPGFVTGLLKLGEDAKILRIDRSSLQPRIFPVLLRAASSIATLPANVLPVSTVERVPVVAAAAVSPLIAPPISMAPVSSPRRYELFLEALRKRNLGPFSRYRKALFSTVAELAKERKFTASMLLRTAIKTYKDSGHGSHKAPPWGVISDFLTTVFSLVPVLRDENNEVIIPNDAGSMGRLVCSIDSNFEALIEAEMIHVVASELKDLSPGPKEFDDLGFALYPEMESNDAALEIEARMSELQTAGRLEASGKTFIALPVI